MLLIYVKHFFIGLIIVSDIFKIGKKQVVMAKNAVVAHVARGDYRQHTRPDSGVPCELVESEQKNS